MVKISIELDWETYLKYKESGKDHRQIYCDGLGETYKERQVGRPRAFDVAAADEAAKEVYLSRIREYNRTHADQLEKDRRELGIDVDDEPDKRGFARFKKRAEG